MSAMPFLMKEEPTNYSYDAFAKDRGTTWTGVKNPLAQKHLRSLRKGDLVFYYHTGDEKQIVGIVKVIKEHYPDPTADGGPWVVVDVEAVEPFKRFVTLSEIKAEPKLKDMILVKYSRLSVQPVKDAEWAQIMKMGEMKTK